MAEPAGGMGSRKPSSGFLGGSSPRAVLQLTVIIAWLCLNVGLNFYNKWAFTPRDKEHHGPGFTFPIFYTWFTMSASFLGANLLMCLAPDLNTISREQFWQNKWSLLVLSMVYVTTVLSQNASLVYISLSVNQIIKCCVPLPTMIAGRLVLSRSYPWPIVVAVFLLVVGAVLSVPFRDASVTTRGLILTFVSLFTGALRPVFSALLLTNADQSGLAPVALLWYDSLFSSVALVVVFCASEELHSFPVYARKQPEVAITLLACGATMAFLFSLVTFYLVKEIGAVGNTVLGNLKTTLLVIIAATWLDGSMTLTAWNWLGGVLFFLALFTYSYLNYLQQNGSLRYPPLPCTCARAAGDADATSATAQLAGSAAVHPAKGPTEKSTLITR